MNRCSMIGCDCEATETVYGRNYCTSHVPLHCHFCGSLEVRRFDTDYDRKRESVECFSCRKVHVRSTVCTERV